MFQKIMNRLFKKSKNTYDITVISAGREIVDIKTSSQKEIKRVKDAAFWDCRGKVYGALFNALNNRML